MMQALLADVLFFISGLLIGFGAAERLQKWK